MESNLGSMLFKVDCDAAAFRRELDGIRNKVAQDSLDDTYITNDGYW